MNKWILYCITALFLGQLQACAQTKNENKAMKITYVMDPQCGWCYGNSKNIAALQEEFKEEFDFELLVGGMWIGQNAPVGGDNLSQFLHNHAPRMATTTGAHVDSSYYELAKDSSYSFSSLEPSAAIQLIKEIAPDKVFLFAKNVQLALFVEGKRLDDRETYMEILETMSIDTSAFGSVWMGADNVAKTRVEFTNASNLANGFPTLVITKEGKTETLASGYFDKKAMIRKLNMFK